MTNRFQKWALATTIATFLLVLVGGLVRASDSGLGCIDWPTCFGKPYPPLTRAELLQRDIPDDFDVDNFNISTAWIEYTNRLTGSMIGLLVLGTLFYAIKDHRKNKRILYPTIGAFITVGVNGWLGKVLIESELDPNAITAHLLLAWIAISLLLYATVSAFYPEGGIPKEVLPHQRKVLARGALIVLGLALIQAAFGAELRGQLEVVEGDNPAMERGDWIHHTNAVDQIHRSYSWVVMGAVLWLGYYVHKRMDYNHWLRLGTQLTGVLVLLQVAAGIGLAYVSLPPPLEVIHLVNATLLLASITLIYLLATRLPVQDSTARQDTMPVTKNLHAVSKS